jgi:hypothetical protein
LSSIVELSRRHVLFVELSRRPRPLVWLDRDVPRRSLEDSLEDRRPWTDPVLFVWLDRSAISRCACSTPQLSPVPVTPAGFQPPLTAAAGNWSPAAGIGRPRPLGGALQTCWPEFGRRLPAGER